MPSWGINQVSIHTAVGNVIDNDFYQSRLRLWKHHVE